MEHAHRALALNTSAGARPPPRDSTVSRKARPFLATASLSSKPTSSKALNASAESTSALHRGMLRPCHSADRWWLDKLPHSTLLCAQLTSWGQIWVAVYFLQSTLSMCPEQKPHHLYEKYPAA